MMRVLDIDLDFFLRDCCPLAERGARPELEGHEPWKAEDVARFLEERCLLDTAQPLPGRVFETHDGALVFWEEKLKEGRLTAPFHVTHIDAHSDLGIGNPGPGFVLYNLIAMPPERRTELRLWYEQKKLDEANYLLFALGMRRVALLEDVREPFSREDIPPQILTRDGTAIRLESLTSKLFEAKNGPEPTIPFRRLDDGPSYQAEAPFDFVTLAMSPRYAPVEADALAEAIRRYIREE